MIYSNEIFPLTNGRALTYHSLKTEIPTNYSQAQLFRGYFQAVFAESFHEVIQERVKFKVRVKWV